LFEQPDGSGPPDLGRYENRERRSQPSSATAQSADARAPGSGAIAIPAIVASLIEPTWVAAPVARSTV